MNYPPPSHHKYFKRSCRCSREPGREMQAVLVRLVAHGTGAKMYSYKCRWCGCSASDFIPHGLLGHASWIDLACLQPPCDTPAALSGLFRQSPQSFLSATVLVPTPSERSSRPVVDAKKPHLHYFVDEAGDPNLFGRKGRDIVGVPGCSKCFMIGAAFVEDERRLVDAMAGVHQAVLADPELRGIESLRPERGKTALMLHAKNDHPRVRSRVFSILSTLDIRVLVVVRRKHALAEVARRGAGGPQFSWQREYDSMIARLFQDRMHTAASTRITIARRGVADRREHLTAAIRSAKTKFEDRWDVTNPHQFSVRVDVPSSHYGLQAIDYYLWALQRAFELDDFAMFDAHREAYRLIVDVDDRRKRPTGVYYTAESPLTLETKKPFEV